MKRLTDAVLVALLLGSLTQAVTPQHPGHPVRLNQLQPDGAVAGQYLRFDGAATGWRPADGVGIPIFVDNATMGAVPGLPNISRDDATGVLTLPSAPMPQASLHLAINGSIQAFAHDFTLSGTTVTPVAAQVDLYKNAVEIVAHYRQ